ncbi:MAG: Ig-like domain-containing protein [Oscillospiraceae bacterium]|nr:Ig-like domain-containing protein [Oscillospiraceae bacterium]
MVEKKDINGELTDESQNNYEIIDSETTTESILSDDDIVTVDVDYTCNDLDDSLQEETEQLSDCNVTEEANETGQSIEALELQIDESNELQHTEESSEHTEKSENISDTNTKPVDENIVGNSLLDKIRKRLGDLSFTKPDRLTTELEVTAIEQQLTESYLLQLIRLGLQLEQTKLKPEPEDKQPEYVTPTDIPTETDVIEPQVSITPEITPPELLEGAVQKKRKIPLGFIIPAATILTVTIVLAVFFSDFFSPSKPIPEPTVEEVTVIHVAKEVPIELPPQIPDEILSIVIPRQVTYLPFGGKQQFDTFIEFTGEVDETVNWSSSDETVATVSDEGLVTGYDNGTVIITATASNGMTGTTEVVITDCIILPSYEYKAFIPAYYYTDEQAAMMDRILLSRIDDAGGPGTRGAVVAAARFITLEMPYMVPYFYENGRMSPHPGRPYCDGEGRYYHVGLYLSVDKYETIVRSVAGPAIWGAPLTNYQNAGYFTSGNRYPNGLDCSGFVSWAMVNGGIDTGDIGAGDYPQIEKEFSKIGEKLPLSPELLLSGEIKPGDLIGIDGHIAIISGLDDTHIWISESYYRGVNTVCFTINRGVMDCQEYDFVIKMDHMYYAGEGTYTDTWVEKDTE